MNERIEKLSQLAWTKTSETVPFYDSTGNISRDFNLKYQQKFAELIVRECMSITQNCLDSRTPDTYADNIISQHFGVKE